MPVDYRVSRYSDYAAAYSLWERCDGIGLSVSDRPEAIAAYLSRNPTSSFVATDGRVVMATILCGHDGRRGLIHHLAVDAAYRRQGVGKQLVMRGLAALHAAGIDKCYLTAMNSNQAGAIFWTDIGAVPRNELGLYSLWT